MELVREVLVVPAVEMKLVDTVGICALAIAADFVNVSLLPCSLTRFT